MWWPGWGGAEAALAGIAAAAGRQQAPGSAVVTAGCDEAARDAVAVWTSARWVPDRGSIAVQLAKLAPP